MTRAGTAKPTDSAAPEDSSRGAISLRPFPSPFQAMLAISSDIDETTVARFREVHRFLNTREETSMGVGLGLDVADSFWFYHPPSTQPDPTLATMSYFNGLDSTRRSPCADELLAYIRAGWIDSIHSYGNFSGVRDPEHRFRRHHAEEALAELDRAGITVKVWINHGDQCNVQNIGSYPYMEGDVPDEPGYHWDLLRDAGVEFLWRPGGNFEFSEPTKLLRGQMHDGTESWQFTRFHYADFDDAIAHGLRRPVAEQLKLRLPFATLWHPPHLHVQFSESRLRQFVSEPRFAIVAQHFGAARPLLRFGGPAIAALRGLAAYQERGEILIARTSRLLEYHRSRDFLSYRVHEEAGATVIDIDGVDDPIHGLLDPTIDRLRGVTFEVPDPEAVRVTLRGTPAPDALVRRSTGGDEAPTIGIAWFDPDHSDYTADFRDGRGSARPVDDSRIREIDGRVRDFLETHDGPPPDGIDEKAYEYAVRYTRGRFGVGLAHYDKVLRSIGFFGLRNGLDIGSGPGHWCIAFAQANERAEGIDSHPEFVQVANGVAEHLGFGDRVGFGVGRAEDLPFPDASVDAVWAHSVLMYAGDTESAIREAARVLRPGRLFYCGYSAFGFRVQGLYRAAAEGELRGVRAQVGNLMADRLYRCGAYSGPWSNVRAMSADELIEMASVFGMDFFDEPNVQDGPRTFLGHAATFDFLARRERDPEHRKRELASSTLDEEAREELDHLIELGCPQLVIDVLDSGDHGWRTDPELCRMYLRALSKAGHARGRLASDLDAEESDPRVKGILRVVRRDYPGAESHFREMHEDDPDRAFLVGCTLVARDEYDDAEACFEGALDRPESELSARIGLVEVAARRGDLAALKPPLAELLRHVARRGGADDAAERAIEALR